MYRANKFPIDMPERTMVERDALLRALQDVLSDIAEDLTTKIKPECEECPVYLALSTFAVKLRKAEMHEESEIVRRVREKYNI